MRQVSRRMFCTLLGGSAVSPALAQGDPLAGRFGGPFSLVAANGIRTSDTDFRGRFMLVYFGYTHCPDICPDDLLIMADMLKLLGPQAQRVQPLFITVDPDRDTAAIMQDYAASFSAEIIGLSGTEPEISAVARAYRVHRRKLQPAAAGKDQENYIVDHSSLKYLMGPDGAFRTLIPHNTSAERMAEIIKTYLARE